MNLTMKEIQDLAQLERDMDSGKPAFVVDAQGNRWIFTNDVLKECNIKSGQQISDKLLIQVMQVSLDITQAKIDIIQAKIVIENMKGNKDA